MDISRLFNPDFQPFSTMVQKFMAEKFIFEKSGVERFGVEAWGWKVRGWNVLQPKYGMHLRNFKGCLGYDFGCLVRNKMDLLNIFEFPVLSATQWRSANFFYFWRKRRKIGTKYSATIFYLPLAKNRVVIFFSFHVLQTVHICNV